MRLRRGFYGLTEVRPFQSKGLRSLERFRSRLTLRLIWAVAFEG